MDRSHRAIARPAESLLRAASRVIEGLDAANGGGTQGTSITLNIEFVA